MPNIFMFVCLFEKKAKKKKKNKMKKNSTEI